MRNLKKILSLALALVMVMSLVTVASARDFNDAADIEHTEAVDVMSALGVINGKGNNTFDPKGNVTRAEMAKMITYITLGNVEPDAFMGTTTSLTDINGHWAEAYIKYCFSQGIISGRGNGVFDPNANVTAAEAARMLLVAIGYDADVQVYTGSQWTVNVIRDAQISHFFDDVSVASSEVLSRDKAAQMMYNALINDSVEKVATRSITTGEVTWEYHPTGAPLLWKAFGAQVWIGTFNGNADTGHTGVKGEILVTGALENSTNTNVRTPANFPSDFDIGYIGEEVKVIFKDGTIGVKDRPDKNDNIFGVFLTGGTTVYRLTKADLQDSGANDDDPGSNITKIKFNGVKYETTGNIDCYVNYISAGRVNARIINSNNDSVTAGSLSGNGWRKQSVDTIKFVTDTDGKISTAYVVNYNAARVTAVSSDKITLSNVGSINIADNDVASNLAKDDVVIYTKLYDSNKDDAYFTVTPAEYVDGTLTGFKDEGNVSSHKYINVVVDGTTYKVHKNSKDLGQLSNLTDDSVEKPVSNDIGNKVRVYLMNGMAIAMKNIEENGGKYALIVDRSGSGQIGSDIDPFRVVLLLADGTKQTVTIHKDSYVNDGTLNASGQQVPLVKANTLNPTPSSTLTYGTLIEYSSISDGVVKIKNIVNNGNQYSKFNSGTVSGPATDQLWNKDSKKLTLDTATSKTAAAASNAVLFVAVESGSLNQNSDYYAYDLRAMGNMPTPDKGSGGVKYYLNDDGQVVAAYIWRTGKPKSSTAATLYGVVNSYTGSVTEDNTTYDVYKIAVGRSEMVEVKVDASSVWTGLGTATYSGDTKLQEKMIVMFDESNDGYYELNDFTALIRNHNVVTTKDSGTGTWYLGAVNKYDQTTRLLSFYKSTQRSGNAYIGAPGQLQSETVASDVKIIYINSDAKTSDESGFPNEFDAGTGYANILVHYDNSDKVVDVMIVDVGGDGNLANYRQKSDYSSAGTGFPAGVTGISNTTSSTTQVGTGSQGRYYISNISPANAIAGQTVTVRINCTQAPVGSDVITLSGVSSNSVTVSSVGEYILTFTMPATSVSLGIGVSNSGNGNGDGPTTTVLPSELATAVGNGGNIEVASTGTSITVPADLTVQNGTNVTFTQNTAIDSGKGMLVAKDGEVTVEGDLTLTGSNGVAVNNGGTLTLKGNVVAGGAEKITVNAGGKLIIDSGEAVTVDASKIAGTGEVVVAKDAKVTASAAMTQTVTLEKDSTLAITANNVAPTVKGSGTIEVADATTLGGYTGANDNAKMLDMFNKIGETTEMTSGGTKTLNQAPVVKGEGKLQFYGNTSIDDLATARHGSTSITLQTILLPNAPKNSVVTGKIILGDDSKVDPLGSIKDGVTVTGEDGYGLIILLGNREKAIELTVTPAGDSSSPVVYTFVNPNYEPATSGPSIVN